VLDIADIVSGMTTVKDSLDAGRKGRRGVEW
jgi:ATP:corrinoid adenosyltransferase